MKIIHCNRTLIYKIIATAFKVQRITPTIAELGVFKGDNAQDLLDVFMPKKMHLIDSWSYQSFLEAYRQMDTTPRWMDPPEKQSRYYGKDLMTESFWENLYRSVKNRFSDDPRVDILRADTSNFPAFMQNFALSNPFDYLYLDGSHQFEQVYSDLMNFSETLTKNGVIQLNDCCHSELGLRQNLGVLEAVCKFLKSENWTPLILNTVDFSDLVIAKANSVLIPAIDYVLSHTAIEYIEMPNCLLPAAKLIRTHSGKQILSF